jgi:hypothetical protein
MSRAFIVEMIGSDERGGRSPYKRDLLHATKFWKSLSEFGAARIGRLALIWEGTSIFSLASAKQESLLSGNQLAVGCP